MILFVWRERAGTGGSIAQTWGLLTVKTSEWAFAYIHIHTHPHTLIPTDTPVPTHTITHIITHTHLYTNMLPHTLIHIHTQSYNTCARMLPHTLCQRQQLRSWQFLHFLSHKRYCDSFYCAFLQGNVQLLGLYPVNIQERCRLYFIVFSRFSKF